MAGTTLEQQYQQTLQNTIGQSQKKRNEYMRMQGQSSSSNVPTQWEQRGSEGFRGAGWQDSASQSSLDNVYNPSYIEGGQERFGTYSNNSAYYQPMLDMQKGMRDYDDAQAKYKQQLDQYNQQLAAYNQQQQQYKDQQASLQSTIDDLYSRITSSTADYQNRYGPGLESLKKYVPMGFVPGKNNGDWQWYSNDPINLRVSPNVDSEGTPYGDFEEPSLYEKGSGYWLHSNGSPRGVTYSPSIGIGESDFDHKATGFNKWMPALTMTTLGGMFGAAGGLIGGTGLAGSVGSGMGAALPSAIATGANTGDWGKALTQLGAGAISGGLTRGLSPYIKDGLGSLFGDTLSQQTLNGLTKAGTGAATGIVSKGISNALSKNKFGKDMGISAVGGALAGLGGLFTPQGGNVADYETLASTLGKIGTAAYKARRK